jgi:uncharacterized protein (TIGR02996 family)
MNAQRGFLQAIAETPDDDALRLIFADWLQDHDKPTWAEVIRRQIAAQPLDPDGFHEPMSLNPGWFSGHVNDRIREHLRDEMGYPVPLTGATFRRGLVEHISLTVEELLEYGEEMAAWGPVPLVHPTGAGAHLETLARWNAPPGLTRLNLYRCGIEDDNLRCLVGSRLFAGLTELGLSNEWWGQLETDNRLTHVAGSILARAEGLRSLRRLDLGGLPLRDEGLLELSRAPTLRGLTALYLPHCQISGSAFRSWGEKVPWPELRALDLSGNPLRTDDAGFLTASPQLGSLRRLCLTFAQMPDQAAVLLGQSRRPIHLRELDLTRNFLEEVGTAAILESSALAGLRRLNLSLADSRADKDSTRLAVALANAPCAGSLEQLDLTDHSVGDAGALALVEPGRYPRLKKLTLGKCGMGVEGARALHKWAVEGGVEVKLGPHPLGPDGLEAVIGLQCHLLPTSQGLILNLEGMRLGLDGIERLLTLPDLARCYDLNLTLNDLTTAAVERLASCPVLASLLRFNLGRNPIGDAGATALANSPCLAGLRTLELGHCELTDAGVAILARSTSLPMVNELVLFGNSLTDVAGQTLAGWPSAELTQVHLNRGNFSNATWTALAQRFGDGLHSY